MLGACAAKVVEFDVEPVVDLLMLLVVFGTYGLATKSFFKGLCLGGSAVFVSTTKKQCVQTLNSTES